MNIVNFFRKHEKNTFVRLLQKVYLGFMLNSNAKRITYLRKSGAKVGKNCTIGSIGIFGSEPYLVEVGDNVYFSGSNIALFTHDGGTMQLFYMGIADKKYDNFGKIKIGNNCFVGAGCTILKNVTIGDNCIIGAGAIVTKSIPANSVVAGVPARIVCSVEEYYEKNKTMYDDTVGWNSYDKFNYIEKNMNKYEERRLEREVKQ